MLLKLTRILGRIPDVHFGSRLTILLLFAVCLTATLVMHGCHAGGHDDLEP